MITPERARSAHKPLPRWSEIPDPRQLSQLVRQLKQRWRDAPSVREALRSEGWRVSERRFAPGSTLRALVTPLPDGRFAAAINAAYDPTPRMVDWLLCHEVGHVVFRGTSNQTWRTGRDFDDGRHEEQFCNLLADRMIGRTSLSRIYENAS